MKRALLVACTAALVTWGVAVGQTRDETQATERTQTTVEEQTRARVQNPDAVKPGPGNQQGDQTATRAQDRTHKPDQGQGQQQGPQGEANNGPQAQEQKKTGPQDGTGNKGNPPNNDKGTQAKKKTGPQDGTGPKVGSGRDRGTPGSGAGRPRTGGRGGGRGR